LEERRSVIWILIISIIMFFVTAWIGPSLVYVPYYPPREPTVEEFIWFYINRTNVLLFVATITSATLFTAGFWRKELMYKLSILLFTVSMGLLFITFLKSLFVYPWAR